MKPLAVDIDRQSLKALGFELAFEVAPEVSGGVDGRWVLRDLQNPDQLPLAVDFLSSQLTHRRRQGLSKGQPLPKALGLKSLNPDKAPYVFDATAGLGVDAFMIASLGCRVRAVERSPVIFDLLEDGERRLREEAARRSAGDEADRDAVELVEIAARLSFEHGHSREILASMGESERPDVVYLDPMYPEEGRSKSALPKKGMQMFRRLLGEDTDYLETFQVALTQARERVVVKRPLYAPPLQGRPTHSFEGKTARYDMYFIAKK